MYKAVQRFKNRTLNKINCGNDNMMIIKENQGKFDVLSKMSYNNLYRE